MLEQWKSRWDGRLAAVLLGRGGVATIREGAEESAPFASGPEPAAIRQVGGGAGNGGLETGEWRRCRSLPFTPLASLRSHGLQRGGEYPDYMVSREPPLTQHRQDQGAGGGLQETEQRTHTHHHRQDICVACEQL